MPPTFVNSAWKLKKAPKLTLQYGCITYHYWVDSLSAASSCFCVSKLVHTNSNVLYLPADMLLCHVAITWYQLTLWPKTTQTFVVPFRLVMETRLDEISGLKYFHVFLRMGLLFPTFSGGFHNSFQIKPIHVYCRPRNILIPDKSQSPDRNSDASIPSSIPVTRWGLGRPPHPIPHPPEPLCAQAVLIVSALNRQRAEWAAVGGG